MASPPHAIKVMDTIWSGALQLLDRFAHERVKAGAAGVEMEEDHLAHPRVPELPDVLGDAETILVSPLSIRSWTTRSECSFRSVSRSRR